MIDDGCLILEEYAPERSGPGFECLNEGIKARCQHPVQRYLRLY